VIKESLVSLQVCSYRNEHKLRIGCFKELVVSCDLYVWLYIAPLICSQ